VSEFLAGWVAGPDAVRTEEGELRRGLSLGLALTALVCMALPAALGILVLLGGLT
jgi:hypothetical protein